MKLFNRAPSKPERNARWEAIKALGINPPTVVLQPEVEIAAVQNGVQVDIAKIKKGGGPVEYVALNRQMRRANHRYGPRRILRRPLRARGALRTKSLEQVAAERALRLANRKIARQQVSQ